MSVAIQVDNVTKAYGKNIVIQGLSAEIKPGEFFTLLGPSGCGKTTLLRMIIGFNSIEAGEIRVDGKVVNRIPTNKRNMGMVFQNYAVFPHMSVRDNVAYGLKNRHVPKEERYRRVDEILKLVKIDSYADRMPAQLSGGQQQRVALARAIVIEPEVLLMDEPLSNLDAKLRVEMRNVIKRIQRQVGITTVYVTHDQEEALAISDRIAVMHGGVIQQIGITTVYVTHDQEEALAISDRIAVMHDGVIQQIDTPKRIYQRPANIFVSTFIGLSNVLKARVRGGQVDFGDGYQVEGVYLAPESRDAGDVLVAVRPEEFQIAGASAPGIPATVKSSVFLGVNLHYFLEDRQGNELEVIAPSDLSEIIPDETPVRLQVVKEKINIFDASSQATLIREGV